MASTATTNNGSAFVSVYKVLHVLYCVMCLFLAGLLLWEWDCARRAGTEAVNYYAHSMPDASMPMFQVLNANY